MAVRESDWSIRALRRMAGLLIRSSDAQFILADLDELLERDLARGLPGWRARWRYGRNALASALSVSRTHTQVPLLSGGSSRSRLASWVPRSDEAATMCYQYSRLALRSARRRPMFLLVATASLAVGVGAVTTMFAAADTLYLRPIPGVQDPRRVVELGVTDAGSGFGPWNYSDFLDLRERAALLEHTAFHVPGEVSLSENGYADRRWAVYSTSSYFEAVGAGPVLGRAFTQLEDVGPGQHAVVVISNDFWQQHFGGSTDVLGATLRLNGETHTVVGVAGEEFRGLTFGIEPDVYLPLTQHPAVRRSPEHVLGDPRFCLGARGGTDA